MNKNLLIFLCLVLINCAIGTNSTNSTKLQGSKGSVTIYKDSSKGFYVGADFKYDYSRAADRFGPYTYSMYLGLYTSQTLLANSDCLSFNYYRCQWWSCTPYTTVPTVSYPYFTAYGVMADTEVYVDYNGWSLYTQSLYASQCQTNSASYGTSSYGIIGMGVNGNNKYNFKGAEVFSIYLNKDLSGGQLLFRQDLAYATSNYPTVQFSADNNWKASLGSFSSIQVGSYSSSISANLIFDMNENAIGFPTAIYNQIMSYLKTYGVDCAGLYQPNCTYYGYISSLPFIYIKFGNGDSIPIPPEIYAQNASYPYYVNTVTLNLRALGTNYSGYNYVTPAFSDCIILDANFMRYYYTVFDASSSFFGNKISIYLAGTPPSGPGGLLIVGIVLTIIVACSICGCIKRANKKVNSTVVTTTTVVQPPLLIHQGQTQVYMPPSMQYVQQPQGGYPQQPQGGYPQQGFVQQGFVQTNYGH